MDKLVHDGKERGYVVVQELFDQLSNPRPHVPEVAQVLRESGVDVPGGEAIEEKEQVWTEDPSLQEFVEQELEEVEEEMAPEDEVVAEEAAEEAEQEGLEPLAIYLREIDRWPLLIHQQEIDLAKAIEKAKDAQKKLGRKRKASAGETRKLQDLVRQGQEARRTLMESNLRLVVSVAKRYMGRGLPLLDLIQEGNIGLARAVEKYDHTRGFRFSTYAHWWIRQAVTRSIADQARTIRVPVHMIELIGAYHQSARRLQQMLGREPTADEVARDMNVAPQRVKEIVRASRQPISLEAPVGEEEERVADLVADKLVRPPAEAAVQLVLQDEIGRVLEKLTDREQIVLKLRFGLEEGRPHTLEEIGEELGISRERVRQIEKEALAKLRSPQLHEKMKEYLE
ncbi:MAG: sigma-70 family RNA polymerase sigma factor [Chloroflexi bacterium]|nr:sigma-70 family RNA polymerase sigma factor [Chloroflexota bacterium]